MPERMKFSDFDTEKFVLAGLLRGPEWWRSIPPGWFKEEIAAKTYEAMQALQRPPYRTYPTVALMLERAEDPEVWYFVNELATIRVQRQEFGTYVYDLFEMWAARKAYDAGRSIPNALERGRVEAVVRAKIVELSGLTNPFQVGRVERGWIYDGVGQRLEQYEDVKIYPDRRRGIPFGIKGLDDNTLGLREEDIVMFYAGTGGFKTKILVSLAYNFSFLAGKPTMVMTLEVPKRDYEHFIDSRHSLQSYTQITKGQLAENESLYKAKLQDIAAKRPPLFIVDIPGDATSADIKVELEKFYAMEGYFPSALVIDYAREMSPVTPWGNTGEKYGNLGVEMRQIVRQYKVPIITALQENRKGSETKDPEKVGLEHVGESHSFANVCGLVVHLAQDDISEGTGELSCGIRKNRFGPNFITFNILVDADHNFCGDHSFVQEAAVV